MIQKVWIDTHRYGSIDACEYKIDTAIRKK